MSARRLRLVLTERAASDVRSIQQYSLEHWGSARATAYDEAIHHALETLRAQPHLGKNRDELLPGLRSHPVLSHIIFYRVEGDALTVQRIVHERMDVTRVLLP